MSKPTTPSDSADSGGPGVTSFPPERVGRFGSNIDHSEGVAVGPDGFVYAGGELGQVYKISPDGSRCDELAAAGGFSLGITLDRAGNLFICNHLLHVLLKIDPRGTVSRFCDRAGPHAFRTPNFSVFDPEGNLYMSDSGEWKKNNGLICRINPAGVATVFHPGPFAFANGLALNPAGDALYVIESNTDSIRRIEIKRDGTRGDESVFCRGLAHVPDGMAFDAAGNLFVAIYGLNRIYKVDPAGRVNLFCEDLENACLCTPTNVAFGGPKFDRLYIGMLGARHLGIIDLGQPGQPLFAHGRD